MPWVMVFSGEGSGDNGVVFGIRVLGGVVRFRGWKALGSLFLFDFYVGLLFRWGWGYQGAVRQVYSDFLLGVGIGFVVEVVFRLCVGSKLVFFQFGWWDCRWSGRMAIFFSLQVADPSPYIFWCFCNRKIKESWWWEGSRSDFRGWGSKEVGVLGLFFGIKWGIRLGDERLWEA